MEEVRQLEKKDRIRYLDYARGFAVFTMFLQHTMLAHELSGGDGDTLLGNIFVLLGTAPAAPVFMLIMGIFLGLSRKGGLETVWRGVKLLILGYILNLLRFSIPLLLAGDSGMDITSGETPLSLLLTVDIFQLAGLAMICSVPLKRFINKSWIIALVAALVALISPLLWGLYDRIYPLAMLWGEGRNIFFPLFPYLLYPLLGMALAGLLTNRERLAASGKWLITAGIGAILLGAALLILEIDSPGDYHRSGPALHLIIAGFILLWLLLWNLVEKKVSPENPILKLLYFWSKNVTSIYFIQWVLFGFSILIFGANEQVDYIAALIGAGVLLITDLTVRFTGIKRLFAWI